MAEPAFLLDSNICIYILADAACAPALRVGSSAPGSVVTSTIAYAEVMRKMPHDDPAVLRTARRFFDKVAVLPFDLAAADAYHRVPFRRSTFDRLIAAHALAFGLILITNNKRDFADVVGLQVENWTLE